MIYMETLEIESLECVIVNRAIRALVFQTEEEFII